MSVSLTDIKRKQLITLNTGKEYRVVGTRQIDQTVILWDANLKRSFQVSINDIQS